MLSCHLLPVRLQASNLTSEFVSSFVKSISFILRQKLLGGENEEVSTVKPNILQLWMMAENENSTKEEIGTNEMET